MTLQVIQSTRKSKKQEPETSEPVVATHVAEP